MHVPGLRSPHDEVGGIVYFGRMLDKIRLHAKGALPEDYIENLGDGFDARCLSFLHVDYPGLVTKTNDGGSDEEILEWCFAQGHHPDEEAIEIWNDFMRKRGWNDALAERLEFRLKEAGQEHRTDIQTMFDYIDLDEGRDPANRTS